MNAVEKLEAAITKLENLKAASTQGTWKHEDEYGLSGGKYVGIPVFEFVTARAYAGSESNAALIVTLHRTIDAQLAVVRSAADFLVNAEGEWPLPIWEKHPELRERLEALLDVEVALADAILGDAS